MDRKTEVEFELTRCQPDDDDWWTGDKSDDDYLCDDSLRNFFDIPPEATKLFAIGSADPHPEAVCVGLIYRDAGEPLDDRVVVWGLRCTRITAYVALADTTFNTLRKLLQKGIAFWRFEYEV